MKMFFDFANKIIQLLDNEELREKMSDLGYKRVKSELSWGYESKKLVNFYKKVLN